MLVLGASADPEKLLAKFRAKQKLNFPLLSDPDHNAIEADIRAMSETHQVEKIRIEHYGSAEWVDDATGFHATGDPEGCVGQLRPRPKRLVPTSTPPVRSLPRSASCTTSPMIR